MPNTTVPAAGEGVPADAHVAKRVGELAGEIAQLLDRVPKKGHVVIYPESTGQQPRYELEIAIEGSAVQAALLEGVDKLGSARAFVDLLMYAMDGICGNPGIRSEINALQYGISEIYQRLEAAKENFERARSLADCG